MNSVALKQIVATDIPIIYKVVDSNREYLKNLVWAEKATIESVAEYINLALRTEIIRAITLDGAIVGLITLRDGGDHHVIGYWLAQDYGGRGIMTKAVGLICSLVRVPVFASIKHINVKSRRVLLKNEFKYVDSDGEWDNYIRVSQ